MESYETFDGPLPHLPGEVEPRYIHPKRFRMLRSCFCWPSRKRWTACADGEALLVGTTGATAVLSIVLSFVL